jgi:hypothetical protein
MQNRKEKRRVQESMDRRRIIKEAAIVFDITSAPRALTAANHFRVSAAIIIIPLISSIATRKAAMAIRRLTIFINVSSQNT